MKYRKIVMLAGQWETTPIFYNSLTQAFPVDKVIIEKPVPKKTFLSKRIKKLGWLTVLGQVLFSGLVARSLARRSQKQIEDILARYSLYKTPIPTAKVLAVDSVNSPDAISQLQALSPDLVLVHGTRIISKKVLQAVNCPFINIHAGITPRYRGSHGAYWALANKDVENCGVTVHLVDAGIDTGNILAQAKIPFTSADNFATYPYLQLAEGLILLKQCIAHLENGERPKVQNQLNSALWHHPTLWGYWITRLNKGVR